MQTMSVSKSEGQRLATALDYRVRQPDGRIKLLPASEWQSLDRTALRVWCHFRAMYAIPTLELVDWLKAQIGDRTAIEIGAGNNDLGFYLGIKQTDSYMQTHPVHGQFYQMTGQTPTRPGPDVEKLNAAQAIAAYRPQVVIGAWITQLWQPGDEQGSEVGVDEGALIDQVGTYIHIGHAAIHGGKRVLSRPHQEFRPDWLVSRMVYQPEGHFIATWERKGDACTLSK